MLRYVERASLDRANGDKEFREKSDHTTEDDEFGEDFARPTEDDEFGKKFDHTTEGTKSGENFDRSTKDEEFGEKLDHKTGDKELKKIVALLQRAASYGDDMRESVARMTTCLVEDGAGETWRDRG